MRRIACAMAGIALLGCGGGGGGGTEPNPVPTTLTIAVSGGTGSMSDVGDTRTLTATVRDQNGQVMTGTQVGWVSSATSVVTVSPATGATTTATAVGEGTATVTASIGAVDDDQALTVDLGGGGPFPGTATVVATATNSFDPDQVDIADEGTVTWDFEGVTHNVQFAATAGAPTNIGNSANTQVSRTFGTPGTFNYGCTIHPGMNGTVVVH